MKLETEDETQIVKSDLTKIMDWFNGQGGFFFVKSIWGGLTLLSLLIGSDGRLVIANEEIYKLKTQVTYYKTRSENVGIDNLHNSQIFIYSNKLIVSSFFKSIRKVNKKRYLNILLKEYIKNKINFYREFIQYIDINRESLKEFDEKSMSILITQYERMSIEHNHRSMDIPYAKDFYKIVDRNEETLDINIILREGRSCSTEYGIHSYLQLEEARLKNLILLLDEAASEMDE